MNPTLQKFGYPHTLVQEYEHWCVLLRTPQVTLGSLVLAAKAEVTSYPALPAAAFAEQQKIMAAIESALKTFFEAEKFNYLMLMMVDPNPHFHVLPRYSGPRTFAGATVADAAWPKPVNLAEALPLTPTVVEALHQHLKTHWPK